jgi:hypothetical protein
MRCSRFQTFRWLCCAWRRRSWVMEGERWRVEGGRGTQVGMDGHGRGHRKNEEQKT